jgi:hypothetical protein
MSESDLQTSNMGDDILRMIVLLVCLRDRDGRDSEAVEQLKATYPDEAKNAELDITAKLGELALQHCIEALAVAPALSTRSRGEKEAGWGQNPAKSVFLSVCGVKRYPALRTRSRGEKEVRRGQNPAKSVFFRVS